MKAFNALADRIEGRVPLPIARPDWVPIQVEFSFRDSGLQTTEDELRAIDIEAIDSDSDCVDVIQKQL